MRSPRQPPPAPTSHFLTSMVLLAVIIGLLSLLLRAELADAAPRLDERVLPASGTQQTLLHTERFGRYAILVDSDQGAALQLVDRMAGPIARAGEVGQRDGRLDLFLDRGTTKLLVHSHERAEGQLRLEVHDFEELNSGLAPVIEERRLIESELGDLQQRSWWLKLEQRQPVALEAAGRHLADLRLWRDGTWLVETTPRCETIQPTEGRPLRRCRLSGTLEPGLYLLSAYGGPSQAWSREGPERPLWLQAGTDRLAEAGRRMGQLDATGEARFLIPGEADHVQLELPEARPASLTVAPWSDSDPFGSGGATTRIQEESVPPRVALNTSRHDGWNLVTIRGEAGQPYVLQHFPSAEPHLRVPWTRSCWLSTLHSGDAQDQLEATAMLVRRDRRSGQIELVEAHAVELSGGRRYHQRFDLMEPGTLFIHVDQPGSWAVTLDDPKAEILVEPFFARRPERYEPPPAQRGETHWELEAGYHVVSIDPHRQGVAELTIEPHGVLDSVLGAVGMERERERQQRRSGPRFAALTMDPAWDYSLISGQVPGARMGLIQRELPLALGTPLPLTLAPGEQVELQVTVPERGELKLLDDRGALLELALGDGSWAPLLSLRPGRHDLRLRNPRRSTVAATLSLETASRRPDAPLQPIEMEALAAIPDFPLITADQPAFFDLERGGQATFRLQVDEPALYVLESTGLLATEGWVRTRTVLSLAEGVENGVGRNFLIQSYLGSGEYQVTVQARGASRGHAGLRLRRSRLDDGGALVHGLPARASVPAGDGLVYRFSVDEEGMFDLNAIGEQRGFRCRLEDGEGWPVERPGAMLPDTRWLQPGDYRLVLLPEPVATRRVTTVAPVASSLSFEGHGPHPLPLGQGVQHTWSEPQDGGERAPDRWRFALPATVPVVVQLGEDMAGELVSLGEEGETTFARVSPSLGWQGELPAGSWELRARAARRDHGLPYTARVQPEPLLVGMERQLSVPARVGVAVGEAGLVELASLGDRDVRARLYGPDGRLLASSDDRPEDWNFQLVQRLEPGHYQLRLDPVGAAQAVTTVSVSAPNERVVEPLRAGREHQLEPGREVLLLPLEGLPEEGVAALSARSAESVGLVLEAQRDGAWRAVAEDLGRAPLLLARLGEVEGWRLRLWSLDRRGNPVAVRLDKLSHRRVSEARLAQGLGLSAGRAATPTGAAVRVTLDRPGLLETRGDPVRWCPAPAEACTPVQNHIVSPDRDELWLVATLREPGERVTMAAQRRGLDREVTGPVTIPSSGVVIADVERDQAGPVLVTARSVEGQPLLRLEDRAAPSATQDAIGGADLGDRAAVAVALGAQAPRALASSQGSPELRLQATSFLEPLTEPSPGSQLDEPLPAGAARAWALPGGPLRLQIALSEGLVAVLEGAEGQLATAWAQGAPRAVELRGPATRLVVLNPTDKPGRISAGLDQGAAALGPSEDQPLERRTLRAGSFRIPIAPLPAGARLHLRGAATQGVISAPEGVQRGLDLELPATGATVEVHHEPGLVLAWVDRPDTQGAGLWGATSTPWTVQPELPSQLEIEGPTASLSFSPEAPTPLLIRAPQDLVVGVRHGEGPLVVSTHEAGASVDLLLPGGPSDVLLRPLGADRFLAPVELSSSPVVALSEGLGPELLLRPGQTRFFSFEVEREGPVGLGVHADADTVELTLLSPRGEPLGQGLAQMPTLQPGPWLMAIALPAHAEPVRLQPVVVGIDPPDTGPPEDVIRQYLRLASNPEVQP